MKRELLISWVLAVTLTVVGCGGSRPVRGSGKVVTEAREVSDFTGVELATLGTLTIELGDSEKLIVEAEDNLLPYLETEVHDETLVIKAKRGVDINTSKPIGYYLTATALNSILVSSTGDVQAPDLQAQEFVMDLIDTGSLTMGDLYAETFRVTIRGPGNLVMEDLTADMLFAYLSSTGNLHIGGGKVGAQNIIVTGSGDYIAEHLSSSTAEVRLTYTGSATIGDVETEQLAPAVFRAGIRGSGGLKVGRLTAERAEVGIAGEGDLDIGGGLVEEQSVNINGSGDYNARNLESIRAEVRLGSVGSATIWVREYLKANISGSGSVRCAGNPTVERTGDGLGRVETIED